MMKMKLKPANQSVKSQRAKSQRETWVVRSVKARCEQAVTNGCHREQR